MATPRFCPATQPRRGVIVFAVMTLKRLPLFVLLLGLGLATCVERRLPAQSTTPPRAALF